MGHPDKMCDQISDAVLDTILAQDPTARVACETATTTGLILLAGEITTTAHVDYPNLVRGVVKDIGYTSSEMGFDAATCAVLVALGKQSPDIAQGVNESEASHKELGAGDQGMMFGFACDETPELMPTPIHLAHRLMERHRHLFTSKEIPFIRPDAKSQVTVEYDGDKPVRIQAVVVSTQHEPGVSYEELKKEVLDKLIRPTLPGILLDEHTKFHINPTGKFVVGGPLGDSGLTGRKIIVDTYGGTARHGGGAFSGKDCTKVDRSAAYAARWVAKNVVAAGLARRCEVQVAYAIGVSEPVSIRVETFGTGAIDENRLEKLIRDHFDLRPAGIIAALDLRRPQFRQTSCFGHFGREGLGFKWEETDRAEVLRKAAKI